MVFTSLTVDQLLELLDFCLRQFLSRCESCQERRQGTFKAFLYKLLGLAGIKLFPGHQRCDSDTENCIRFDKENKPGVANLMTIYSAVTGKTFEEIENEFIGKGYGAFKPVVGEAVVEHLRPIREESMRLMKDKGYLESVYRNGAEKASYVAEKTLRKVYKKVGFVQR